MTMLGNGYAQKVVALLSNSMETYCLSLLGPYQKYIEALSWSNPSLKKPDPANEGKNGGKPLAPRNAAVALLESSASGRPEFEKTELDCVQLTKHFEKTDDAHNKRRIYIMEGLAPDYIATLGGHFFMDPTFFQRQERTCVWSNDFTPTSDALPQPSTLTPDTMFHVQYCELRQFNQALPNTFFFCDRTGRHVGMTAARTAKEKSTTGILRRKASWWSRKTSGGGWDGNVALHQLFDHNVLTCASSGHPM